MRLKIMAEVIQLHVWMRDAAHQWCEKEVLVKKKKKGKLRMEAHPGKRVVVEVPPNASSTEMKILVAEVLQKYMSQLEYYYVVAVTERDDGSEGFRTVVRKTAVL